MLLEKLQKQRKLQPHKRRQQWQQQLKLQRRQHRKQLQLQVFQKSFHHRHQSQHNQQPRNQHQLPSQQQQLRSPNQHQLNQLPLRSKMWLSQLHRQQRVHGQLLQHNKSLLWINQNHQMLNFIHLEDHQV